MGPTATDLAWLRLALAEGVGPVTVRRLLEIHGDVQSAARATRRDFERAGSPGRAGHLEAVLRAARPARVWEEARRLGQRVLTPASEEWPQEAFQALPGPPAALYVRGRLPPADVPCVAIVGSRDAGRYGLRMARAIAEDLAARRIWVVSGMALGIDGAAHAGALRVPDGRTVAILGAGLDVAYPAEHMDLKEEIAERGGVATEHPPGTEPRPGHFPRRNRLVAALAEITVVVQARRKSGALSTANHAVNLGRSVMAVPGPVSIAYRGSHGLLKRGQAALCEDALDVLELLELTTGARTGSTKERSEPPPPPSGPPLALWGVFQPDESVGAEELGRRTGLDPVTVMEGLAFLEIEGYIARVPGLGYRRAHESR